MKNFRKIELEFFSNSAFSQNFRDFLDKYCHISVVVVSEHMGWVRNVVLMNVYFWVWETPGGQDFG
jgi:hypothetical protein